MRCVNMLIFLFIAVLSFKIEVNGQVRKGMTISGNIKGLKDGSVLYLMNQNLDTIDFSVVKNERFSLKETPFFEGDFRFIFLNNVAQTEKFINLFVDYSNIGIKGSLEQWPNLSVTGSPANSDFEFVSKKMNDINKKSGQNTNDLVVDLVKQFARDNPNSVYAPFLLAQKNGMTTADREHAYNNMEKRAKRSKYGIELQKFIAGMKKAEQVGIGKKAPELAYPSPDGKTISLHNIIGKSKLTLLDFWASWCIPCRRETPNVRNLYNQFHDQGLNIVSVSLDSRLTDWKEAIIKDTMPWYHMSDLIGKESHAATAYSASVIPTCYLIDEKGVVIAENLSGDGLRLKVSEYFSDLSMRSTGSFSISGELSGANDNRKVILTDEDLNPYKTTTLKNNAFSFKGAIEKEGAFYFLFLDSINPQNKFLFLFLDNSEIKIKGSIKDWPKISVTGSYAHSDFESFSNTADSMSVRIDASHWKDSLTAFSKKFMHANINSLYTPFLLTQPCEGITIQDRENIYASLSKKAKTSYFGRQVPNFIAAFKKQDSLQLGKRVPELYYPDPYGRMLSLHAIASVNKLTLVNFWSLSDSAFLRQAPLLRNLRKKYFDPQGNKGLGIVSFCFENDVIKWRKAVKSDSLSWLHMGNLKDARKSEVIQAYKVDRYPVSYLIDQNGILVAQDLVGDKLSEWIKNFYKNEKDSLWSRKPSIDNYGDTRPYPCDTSKLNTEEEKAACVNLFIDNRINALKFKLDLRKWVIAIWNAYPDDPRKYQSLVDVAATYSPLYYQDLRQGAIAELTVESIGYDIYAALDLVALNQWRRFYDSCRFEFMKSEKVTPEMRRNLIRYEIYADLLSSQHVEFRGRRKYNLLQLTDLFKELAPYEVGAPRGRMAAFNYVASYSDVLYNIYGNLGLKIADLKLFYSVLQTSQVQWLKDYAAQRLLSLNSAVNTFGFSGTTLDGKKFDSHKLQGKVVLFDFWDIGCSSCIQKMPGIKRLYEKYKSKGFEVVSICLSPITEKEQILKIQRKVNADWPTLIVGGKKYQDNNSSGWKFQNEYGFYAVPILFLFDKQGKIADVNGAIFEYNSLEERLIKLL